MLDKKIQIMAIDRKTHETEVIKTIHQLKLRKVLLLALCVIITICYLSSLYLVVDIKKNLVTCNYDDINGIIGDYKSELVYNYIKENKLNDYSDLEEIKGISTITIEKLKKYTYIKGVK